MNDEELRQVKHAAQLHGMPVREVAEVLLDDEVVDVEQAIEESAAEEDGASKKPRSRKLHWVAWTTSMIAMGAVIGFVVVGIMKFVNDPVESGVKTVRGAATSVAPATPGTSQLSGLHVALAYPGSYDQVAQTQSNARVIEQYRISSKTNHRRAVTVSVWPLLPGGVDDDASYRTRLLDLAGSYDETIDKIEGEKVHVMTKADKSEQTLFWPHKDKLLIVAVSSSDPRDDVPAMMKVIKESARWVK